MKMIKGGITKPKGFKANGMFCGIKRSGRPDLSLIYSEVPAATAAVFTKNSVKAAPLTVCQKHLKSSKNISQAIVINSGNANCFTGRFGFIYAERTTEVIAGLLGIPKNYVLVSSTGIIGKPLPVDKIQNAAPVLVKGLSSLGSNKAAWGILTTDTKIKVMTVEIKLDGKTVTIGAIAKGSGMTAPNMATMLSFITTDAAISTGLLKQALKEAVNESFNSITIDGCMSTNDMVVVMANGAASNKKISKNDGDYKTFLGALKIICKNLAKQIVLDAEGVTKFIEIHINGAATKDQARTIGLTVANSNLVKTAAFGSNPNWGRVAAAVGSLGIKRISEENLKISFSPFDKKNISIFVDLNLGQAQAVIYTSDLSYEYVKINGEYN
jgi:glutamate N-acetyltransferase/amino-acid N-acetyltransferase